MAGNSFTIQKAVRAFACFALLMFPVSAHAHFAPVDGFLSGFTHPFSGIDHLAAMIAVGIIGAQMGSKDFWKLPAIFISFMIFGGILAMNSFVFSFFFTLPVNETGIALSVLIFGALIAASKKFPFTLALALTALFAFFHGSAHGQEMPLISNSLLLSAGFVLATAGLHISGVLLGHFAKKSRFTLHVLRLTGMGMAGFGAALLYLPMQM